MTGRQARAAVVHLGRTGALGNTRRVESWRLTLEAAGLQTTVIPLLPGHRWSARSVVGSLAQVLAGTAVPEALAWTPSTVRRELDDLQAQVVVCVSVRAFHPALAAAGERLILDYVDRLSVSYRDRSTIALRRTARVLYRLLAARAERFEASTIPNVIRVAAGFADAEALGAIWVPITAEAVPPIVGVEPDRDVVFVGTLSYPPNIAAVQRLNRVWPALLARRPGTTLLVAGARPPQAVAHAVRTNGWELAADFDRMAPIYARARVAVAPLEHASGIQTKVLDAAAHGVPLVADPRALAGLDPGFPALAARSDAQLVDAIVRLLDEPAEAERLATRARQHVTSHYSIERWAAWVRATVNDPPTAER